VTDAPYPPRLALSQQEAAEALGVSPDFFQQHLRHEIRCVRRGRRRLYPITELQRWLEEQATRALVADSSPTT
jgi:excisionase family DNA binding protein